LELFLPLAGIVDPEVQALQALEPVWARLRAGVRLVPRELRSALRDGPDWRVGFDPPDVPTLYLHGEQRRCSRARARFPTCCQTRSSTACRGSGTSLRLRSLDLCRRDPGVHRDSQHLSNGFGARDRTTTSRTRRREGRRHGRGPMDAASREWRRRVARYRPSAWPEPRMQERNE
jgi:hypothetical protein